MLQMEEMPVNTVDEAPSTLPFEVVLESGAAEHVADNIDAPGYNVEPSPGSKAGLGFIAANGEKIPNRGQMHVKLGASKGVELTSTFQVCNTTRPLWSVGRICDSGRTITFNSQGAKIVHSDTGRELCTFQRSEGLYVGNLSLMKPDGGFPRRG